MFCGGDQLCQSVKLWQSKRDVRYQVLGDRYQVQSKKELPDFSGSPHCVITQFLNKIETTFIIYSK